MKAMMTPEEGASRVPPYKYDDDRQELIVYPKPTKPTDPSLPLVIGDCVHNYRSALDHLAFQLAVVNKSTLGADRIQFPIYAKPGKFKNFVKDNVAPFVSGPALAAIKRLQPYETDYIPENSTLWCLSQLDIIDKHRLLVIVAQQIRPEFGTLTIPTGETFDFELPDAKWKTLEDGTELIRFDLSGAIKRPGKVHMKMTVATTVHFAQTGLDIDDVPVPYILGRFEERVTTLVDDFGKKFFGE